MQQRDATPFIIKHSTLSADTIGIIKKYDETPVLNLILKENNSECIIFGLIKIIYNSTDIEYVTIDDNMYYNYDNTWSGDNDDYECDGYMSGHDDTFQTAKDAFEQPKGKQELHFKYINPSDNHECECKEQCLEVIHKIYNGRDDKIFYHGKIIFINESGWNDDHRGSDHTLIDCDYDASPTLVDPTFSDIMNALYVLKSHKWDTWYELFCEAKVIDTIDGIKIMLGFDHGS
jgi:hypothetical protein